MKFLLKYGWILGVLCFLLGALSLYGYIEWGWMGLYLFVGIVASYAGSITVVLYVLAPSKSPQKVIDKYKG